MKLIKLSPSLYTTLLLLLDSPLGKWASSLISTPANVELSLYLARSLEGLSLIPPPNSHNGSIPRSGEHIHISSHVSSLPDLHWLLCC